MKEEKDKFYKQSVAHILIMLAITIIVYAVNNTWLMRGWLGFTLIMYIVSEASATMLRLGLIDAVGMMKEQDERIANLFAAIITPPEISERELLERSLEKAISEEDYELAGQLRDALNDLKEE